MKASMLLRLEEMSFNKYGVIFSYLMDREKQDLIADLRSAEDFAREFREKRLKSKPLLISKLLEHETTAGAVNYLIKALGVTLVHCPYETCDAENTDTIDRLVLAADFSTVETILESIDEDY